MRVVNTTGIIKRMGKQLKDVYREFRQSLERDTSMRAYRRYIDSTFRRMGFEGGDAAFGTDKRESLPEPTV